MSITDNMGKKSLVALMAVSALVPVMSVQVSASEKVPNAESDFVFEDGVITEYTGDSKDVVIPETIDGVAVTEIGHAAFFSKNLNSVEIPDSVTVIKNQAFQNNKLTEVIIPNSVTEIDTQVFYLNNLDTVEISNSVTEIGSEAFMSNNLTSVEIPNSVTEIGDNPFSSNPDLVEITVASDNPKYMSTENNNAIYTKDGTRLITGTASMADEILDTVIRIGDDAFRNTELTSVNIPNTVTNIGKNAFSWNNLTSVEIPDSVTGIGWNAFRNNNLTTVNIPNSVTDIGSWAFQDNPLTQVTIPETVTSIGSDAFDPSSPLTTADVPIYGLEGSEAETYATPNGHPFNALTNPLEYSQDATLNLFGGTLSLDAPLFESFGTHELQSDIQTVTSSFLDSFKVYDARGTGEGWRLDVTSTQMELVEPEVGFKEGTSTHVLPVGTLSLDQLESIEPFNDSKGTLPSPILDTTSIIDDGAVTIAKADVGEGMGAFELTFGEGAFSATIDPSTAKIDKINYPDTDTPYEATVTWTLVSAP